MISLSWSLVLGFLLTLAACNKITGSDGIDGGKREDEAYKLGISIDGSLQNPAWSPDGNSILFTRFRNGYNEGPADLMIFDLNSLSTRTLVSDGSENINMPGSSWNPLTRKIVFASTRDPHDEIYVIDENGTPGDERKITDRDSMVAYEPTFSPDGRQVVFESHRLDVEDNGIITTCEANGTGQYQEITGQGEDCRQPNWSPTGSGILYQKNSGGQWDIWVNHAMITHGSGNKTDASFSPDGRWIVYSSGEGGLEYANLFICPLAGGSPARVTFYDGYDGAPSWSPNGTRIVFESCPGEPDNSPGTTLWIVDVPQAPKSVDLQSSKLRSPISVTRASAFTRFLDGLVLRFKPFSRQFRR